MFNNARVSTTHEPLIRCLKLSAMHGFNKARVQQRMERSMRCLTFRQHANSTTYGTFYALFDLLLSQSETVHFCTCLKLKHVTSHFETVHFCSRLTATRRTARILQCRERPCVLPRTRATYGTARTLSSSATRKTVPYIAIPEKFKTVPNDLR